ncbi:PEP-CTERM sorting domain-containing protein [Paraglaciecola hydrolytica]|uniref:PEP-CTERM protein-sorting domain-containing protein n=1 Tax=Paraglaciecola hydrolytica TaxID=1799789 RepID=A0A136A6X2_9ALTE|nr:PEP-CTERM sorting domain-containing protein [Paraglaciecola hydrolytica]KXI30971.1 hypothetical protein AX660_00465 [Paraglaciecola hydrolytica]
MNKKMKNIIAALMLTLWGGTAQASLIFDFSFTNSVNNGGGIVTGEILGLLDNATGSATSVRVLSNSSGFGIGEYIGSPGLNVFTVFAGELISFDFVSFGINNLPPAVTDSTLKLTFNSDNILGIAGLANFDNRVGLADFRQTGFSVVQRSVPEPGMFILLSFGIAGLLFSRLKFQKA